MVEAHKQMEKFKEFFEMHYEKAVYESVRKGVYSLYVDFTLLSQTHPDLADELLEEPEETLRAAELSLRNFDIPIDSGFDLNKLRIRFSNLPVSQEIRIRDIRSAHLDHFIALKGIVRQTSDVRPQVVSATFECPSCGNSIKMPQLEQTFKEPSRCSCGRRGHFRLTSQDLIDSQRLVLEESSDMLTGNEQPKRLSVFLREDLVEPKMERRTTPGSKVYVTGVIKEVPIPSKTGGVSTRFDLMCEANFIEGVEETYDDIQINAEDERKIKELARDPKVFEKLINSIAPSIWGHNEIKAALVLQLMGGVRKERPDGSAVKGDIHILLVGEPGTAKSSLLIYMVKAAPKARYVAGRSVTGTGISAVVVKDEFLRGWALEAGALVLANNGLLCLHPKTEVVCDNQIVPIESLFDVKKALNGMQGGTAIQYHTLEKKVPTFNIDTITMSDVLATKIRRKKYEGLMRTIKLRSGLSLKVTPDHKLLAGDNLAWKEAQEFKVGEKLMAPLKLPDNKKKMFILDLIPDGWKVSLNDEEKNEIKSLVLDRFETFAAFNQEFGLRRHVLSGGCAFTVGQFKQVLHYFGKYEEWKQRPLEYIRKQSGERLKIAEVTPELGYVLGFIYGDGCVRETQRRTSIGVVQSFVHQAFIDRFMDNWSHVSYRRIHFVDIVTNAVINSQRVSSFCRQMQPNSNLLGKLFNVIVGNDFSNLLKMDDNVLRAFIAGLLDSDGCMGDKKNGQYKVQHVEFMFAPENKQANLNFVLALRRLDCYGKLVLKNKKWHVVHLTGRTDVEVLQREIQGYSVKAERTIILERIRKLSSISQKMPSKQVAQLCQEIADLSNKSELVKKGLWSTIYYYKAQQLEPSRDQLIKIKENLVLPVEINNRIDLLVKRDYFLDEIVAIEKDFFDGYVYDLYVPGTHNFIAGGVVVHNCIDELDKMSEEDTSALHEALAQQTISIAKANIQATLQARTTVLAAANPKFGRFDPYQPIAPQIAMPPPLINRFDLIFPVKDMPDKDKDTKIASHILEMHQNVASAEPEISFDLLKKFIAYGKQRVFPKLTQGAIEEIKNFYVTLRNMPQVGDSGVRPIPITARQLESLVRLAEAWARVRLSNHVTRKDAKFAIDALKSCLMQVGVDYETGQIDIDRITTGIAASTRNKIMVVRNILSDLEARGKKTIPLDEIMAEAVEKGLSESQVEEVITRLKQEGAIYEPKAGFVTRLG